MNTDELNYELPAELIAQTPAEQRKMSRLLVLNREDGSLSDLVFGNLIDYLNAGDCLVLNNTKVIPARFYARKPTGARLEGLFLFEENFGCWRVLLKNVRKIKSGQMLDLLDRNGKPLCRIKAVKIDDNKGQWQLSPETPEDALAVLEKVGFAPLPPYIKRNRQDIRTADDLQRYQTVYAERAGAVAAPTAGLHFDRGLLEAITAKGVNSAYITLHVGVGTFRPIQTDTLEEHPIHEEHYQIDPPAADTINQTIDSGGRIIAVGTTSVRTLETVAENGRVRPEKGRTRLFIRPGYTFQIVDAMVTNFHLPKSTLLALVGAFAGMDRIMNAYQHAIEQKYRFYSYGDAMLIL